MSKRRKRKLAKAAVPVRWQLAAGVVCCGLGTAPAVASDPQLALGINPLAPRIATGSVSGADTGSLGSLLSLLNHSGSATASPFLSDGLSGRYDWSLFYRSPLAPVSNLSPSRQVGLPFEGQVGSSILGLTYLTKKADFAPTGSPLDFSLLGFNASSDVANGVTLSTGWYSSTGSVNLSRLSEQKYLKTGAPGAAAGVGGGAASTGLNVKLSRARVSTLWTNVDQGFTLGTLDVSGAAQSDAIKTLAAEHGVSRMQIGAGYDLSASSALDFSFNHLKDSGGSLLEQSLAGHADKWSFGVSQRKVDAGFKSFSGLRETQLRGLKSGEAVSTTALNLGVQPDKSSHFQIASLSAGGDKGGLERHSFDYAGSRLKLNVVDQSVGAGFDALANVGDAQAVADAMGAGSHFQSIATGLDLAPGRSIGFSSINRSSAAARFSSQAENLQWGKSSALGFSTYSARDKGGLASGRSLQIGLGSLKLAATDRVIGSGFNSFAAAGISDLAPHSKEAGIGRHTLNLDFAPGAHQSLSFSRLNLTDSHGAIQRQDLGLTLGRFSLSSRSQSVGAAFSDTAHLVDPAEQLLATRERGISQNAFQASYAAGKTAGVSFASDSVRDQHGSVSRTSADAHSSLFNLSLHQLEVTPGFTGAAALANPGLAEAAVTPGLKKQDVDLSLHLGRDSSVALQRVDAHDTGGTFSLSHLSYQSGPGLLLEFGERATGLGFKSFNKSLGLDALALEAGTERQDYHIRLGAQKRNFVDASYMAMAGRSPRGVRVDGLALAPDNALVDAPDLWTGVGEIAAPAAKAAAAPAHVTPASPAPAAAAHRSGSSEMKRAGVSFGVSPGQDTRVEGSFVSFTNGLAFNSQAQNVRGVNLSLKQTLGKDSSLAVVHNTLDNNSGPQNDSHSSVDSFTMKLNTVGGLHLASDYFSQRLPDRKDTTRGSVVLADGSLHLDAHFAQALDASGREQETHSGDIQYAVSRNFTFHLQNDNGGTHLMSDSLGAGVSAPAASTPAPPAGAVQSTPGMPSLPPVLGGQTLALKRLIGGGALGLVFFRGVDPNSLGIGGQQFSFASDPKPSLPLHIQATYNRVATSLGNVPVKRFQLSYSPLHQLTFTTAMDQNRLMPDGKVLSGDRRQYIVSTPTLMLATSSQVDPVTRQRMAGEAIQFHSLLSRGVNVKASLAQNPETPAGLIQHATLRQVEATTGPFTSFYRESKPLVGRIGVTRGVAGTWRISKAWDFNAGVTDNPLDLKGNIVRGESQTWGVNGLLFNAIKFKFDRLGGIADPVTHLRLHSTQLEISGVLPRLGTLNGVYRNDLTAGDSTNWMWSEFTRMGLDPAPLLQKAKGELRGDVYALQYVLPTSGAFNLNIDGALIHENNAALHQADTTIGDFKFALTATF